MQSSTDRRKGGILETLAALEFAKHGNEPEDQYLITYCA